MLAYFSNALAGPTLDIGVTPPGITPGSTQPPPNMVSIKAIADTGAMVTCITAAVATQAGLKVIGKGQMQSASHVTAVNLYFGDLWLAGRNVGGSVFYWPFKNRVFHELLMNGSNHQALLGMDIFCEGVLTVDGPNKRTIFSW